VTSAYLWRGNGGNVVTARKAGSSRRRGYPGHAAWRIVKRNGAIKHRINYAAMYVRLGNVGGEALLGGLLETSIQC